MDYYNKECINAPVTTNRLPINPMRHANRDADSLNTLRKYFGQNRRIPSYDALLTYWAAGLLGVASSRYADGVRWVAILVKMGLNLEILYFSIL